MDPTCHRRHPSFAILFSLSLSSLLPSPPSRRRLLLRRVAAFFDAAIRVTAADHPDTLRACRDDGLHKSKATRPKMASILASSASSLPMAAYTNATAAVLFDDAASAAAATASLAAAKAAATAPSTAALMARRRR